MIACDLIRGVLVLAMAAPGMPLAVTVSLLFIVSMLMAPSTRPVRPSTRTCWRATGT